MQRYVRFFETWNALINRLDEISFWRSIYFLNHEGKKEYADFFAVAVNGQLQSEAIALPVYSPSASLFTSHG